MQSRFDTGPCGRCGVKSYAEFCGDCKLTDRVMTAGGLGAKDMRDRRMTEARWWRELTSEVARVAGYEHKTRAA